MVVSRNFTTKIYESDIQRDILQWLEASKFKAWRTYTGPIIRGHQKMCPNPMAGMTDIQGFMCSEYETSTNMFTKSKNRGRVFFCEVKTECGKLSDKQLDWRKMIEKHGGVYILARSLEDFIKQFMGYYNG